MDAADHPEIATVALRALGLALRELGDLRAANRHLRSAVRLADRAGLPRRAAEARMSLSLLQAYVGDNSAALRNIDRALSGLDDLVAAQALVQRGLILQRLGRSQPALEAYRRAQPVLEARGDLVWLARLYNNRGILQAYLGAHPSARRDLERAEAIESRLGRIQRAAAARHNLGFVAALAGDVPTALRRYDEAERQLAAVGVYRAQQLLDRAAVLLGAGLIGEARETAAHSVEEARAHGVAADLAEAQLVLARAALLDGDPQEARQSASAAAAALRAQRRPAWAVLAQHLLLLTDWAEGRRDDEVRRRARRVATQLGRHGWVVQEQEARLVAARIGMARGEDRQARRDLAACRPPRRDDPLPLRLAAWHALALRRLVDGDRRGAERAARAGVEAVERQQATLGATELRAHIGRQAEEVAQLGLGLALEDGDPRRVLAWSERWRAGALRHPPAQAPDDDALARDLAALRIVERELREATAGGTVARLLRRQAALEEAVRRRTRHHGGLDGRDVGRPPSVAALRTALGERALVEFVGLRRGLYAVVLAAGRLRLHDLGDRGPAERELEALRFALRRLAQGGNASNAGVAAAMASARHAAERLDALLLSPLRQEVGDRGLVIVPTGALHALPWSLLPSCRHRPVAAAPSALIWYRAATRAPSPGPAVLVAAPSPPAAYTEVAALAAATPEARCLAGADATVDTVLSALDGAGLAHLACHGRFRADNPLFSSLDLADGPLTVYDLERLQTAPEVVVLSACDSGLSGVHPGDELMGLAASLLALGTRTLVASVVPVPDAATRTLMLAFHDRLRAGAPPAAALAVAQQTVVRDGAIGLVTAAGFVCFGTG